MSSRNSSLFAPLIAHAQGWRPRSRLVAASRKPDLAGPVLGARYRLLRRLGAAGAVTLHEAEDLDTARSVAIRLLVEPEPGALEQRYLAETCAAIRLHHPNIVEYLDFGRDIRGDGEPVSYLVMEYLEGESLATTLESDGPLRWTQVLSFAKQVCLALIEAHAQSIVHCHIGPAACFRVLRVGAPDLIKVLDFGAAGFACKRTGLCTPNPRAAEQGSVAPELLAGEPFDGRVDVYALGLMMYRLITNRTPYPRLVAVGETGDDDDPTLGLTAPLPMRKGLPSLEVSAALEAVVLQALALDPARRHANARAMYDALVAAEQVSSRPSRLARDPLRWNPERRCESPARAAASAVATSAPRPEPVAEAASSAQDWPGTPSWSARVIWTTLAVMFTTVLVRAAWAHLP